MDKTKKIVFFILLFSVCVFAADNISKTVYFRPDIPHLLEISDILEKHSYSISPDSLSAQYRGELFFYYENDSIRCEIQLSKPQTLSFILDSFMMEPVSAKDVRQSLKKFSIWLLILNAITTILFFARTT